MTLEKVNKYAKDQGYDYAEENGKWREYDLYYPRFKQQGLKVGFPMFILVKGDKIRMSTYDEAYEIIEETAYEE